MEESSQSCGQCQDVQGFEDKGEGDAAEGSDCDAQNEDSDCSSDILITEITPKGKDERELEGSQEQHQPTSKPRQLYRWTHEQILQLSDELMCKLAEQRSLEETGGPNQKEMVRLGVRFMDMAFSITATKADFLVDTKGNCLPNTLSYIANPQQTLEETVEGGRALRMLVIEEVLKMVRVMSEETLSYIQVAAAPALGWDALGDVQWSSREELLQMLTRYREDGVWAGDLGDLMPQIYASFTNTPLFVILYNTDTKKIMGYFLKPSYVFNQPTFTFTPRVVVRHQSHYEPIVVEKQAMAAWQQIYEAWETQQLGMAAIQLTLNEEDLGGIEEERMDAGAADEGKSGGDVGPGQRQQGQDDGGHAAGDFKAVFQLINADSKIF